MFVFVRVCIDHVSILVLLHLQTHVKFSLFYHYQGNFFLIRQLSEMVNNYKIILFFNVRCKKIFYKIPDYLRSWLRIKNKTLNIHELHSSIKIVILGESFLKLSQKSYVIVNLALIVTVEYSVQIFF